MTPQLALLWIQKLVAFAVGLQSLEMIFLRTHYSEKGIWRWSILRKDFEFFPRFARATFDLLLSGQRFFFVSCLHFFAAMLLFLSELNTEIAYLSFLLFCISLLTSIRWRGAFNGGSDSMTLILLAALAMAYFIGPTSITARACLYYLAIQVVLSFFISGTAKLRQPQWRSGIAVSKFLNLQQYGAPKSLQIGALSPILCRMTGWLIVLFEVSVPLALASPATARIYIVIALIFQIINFYLIGLNRFLLAWLAAYPALYFSSFH